MVMSLDCHTTGPGSIPRWCSTNCKTFFLIIEDRLCQTWRYTKKMQGSKRWFASTLQVTSSTYFPALQCPCHIALGVVRQGHHLCGGHILSPWFESVKDWRGTGLHSRCSCKRLPSYRSYSSSPNICISLSNIVTQKTCRTCTKK